MRVGGNPASMPSLARQRRSLSGIGTAPELHSYGTMEESDEEPLDKEEELEEMEIAALVAEVSSLKGGLQKAEG